MNAHGPDFVRAPRERTHIPVQQPSSLAPGEEAPAPGGRAESGVRGGGRAGAGFSSRGRARDEQRRKAAFYLRQHAADDLDRAAKLDGLPAMRLLDEHVEAIAQTIGVPVDDLVAAVMRLWPEQKER